MNTHNPVELVGGLTVYHPVKEQAEQKWDDYDSALAVIATLPIRKDFHFLREAA